MATAVCRRRHRDGAGGSGGRRRPPVIEACTNQDWTGDVSGPVTHECLGRMTYDKIVLGWTEGTTGRRGWKLQRRRRCCADRYSALSDSAGGNGLAGTSFRTNQRRGRALRLDSSDREHLPRPKNRGHAQERRSVRRWNNHWTRPPCSCWARITASRPGAFASDRSLRS